MTTSTHITDTTTSDSRLAALLDGYRARRSARAERNRIQRELATYRTPAELHELDAMIERSGDEVDPFYADVLERLRLRAA